MYMCMAVNNIITEAIGLIFCTNTVNISEWNIGIFRLDILLHFKIESFIVTYLHSLQNGLYLFNPLYKEKERKLIKNLMTYSRKAHQILNKSGTLTLCSYYRPIAMKKLLSWSS